MTDHKQCSCARNADNSITTLLCPVHATIDPCHTKALVTGKRRRGTIRQGTCSHCGWTAHKNDHTHARDKRHARALDTHSIANAKVGAGGK